MMIRSVFHFGFMYFIPIVVLMFQLSIYSQAFSGKNAILNVVNEHFAHLLYKLHTIY